MKVGPNPDPMDPDPENPEPFNDIFKNRKPDRYIGTGSGSVPGLVPGKVGLEPKNPEIGKWVLSCFFFSRTFMEANLPIQHLNLKERSTCWQHFDMLWVVENDGVEQRQARCKYCFATLKADPSRHGTSSLNKHCRTCAKNPNNIARD
ncbi:unnamed protein product [Lactuca saligna]|uniref:BED-type domain-containing protein n=1 Tax=Lactuca saligna TaxID=75948 RepID=A0AA35YNX3_LACSI|nr:unnamed protein product [Lactuca saligna]